MASINNDTAPARIAYITAEVEVPEGCAPGGTLAVVAEGAHMHVTAPHGVLQGENISAQVPKHTPQIGYR